MGCQQKSIQKDSQCQAGPLATRRLLYTGQKTKNTLWELFDNFKNNTFLLLGGSRTQYGP